jgi:hypothetical protein
LLFFIKYFGLKYSSIDQFEQEESFGFIFINRFFGFFKFYDQRIRYTCIPWTARTYLYYFEAISKIYKNTIQSYTCMFQLYRIKSVNRQWIVFFKIVTQAGMLSYTYFRLTPVLCIILFFFIFRIMSSEKEDMSQ